MSQTSSKWKAGDGNKQMEPNITTSICAIYHNDIIIII